MHVYKYVFSHIVTYIRVCPNVRRISYTVTFVAYSSSNLRRPRKSVSKSPTLRLELDSTVPRPLNLFTCPRSLPHSAKYTRRHTTMILRNACIAISIRQEPCGPTLYHTVELCNSATTHQTLQQCCNTYTSSTYCTGKPLQRSATYTRQGNVLCLHTHFTRL